VRGVRRFLTLVENIPVYLRFPGPASLIPRNRQDLIGNHMEFCATVDRLINPTKKNDFDKLRTYWGTAHNSTMFNDLLKTY